MSNYGLVHIDAHFDNGIPKNLDVNIDSLTDVAEYTHEVLVVSDYIAAGKNLGIFKEVFNFEESNHFSDQYVSTVLECKSSQVFTSIKVFLLL